VLNLATHAVNDGCLKVLIVAETFIAKVLGKLLAMQNRFVRVGITVASAACPFRTDRSGGDGHHLRRGGALIPGGQWQALARLASLDRRGRVL
jgi:hypothetical protein